MWLVLITLRYVSRSCPPTCFSKDKDYESQSARTELEIKWQPISNVERGHLLSVSPPRHFAVRPGTFEPSENIWPHNILAFLPSSSLFPISDLPTVLGVNLWIRFLNGFH